MKICKLFILISFIFFLEQSYAQQDGNGGGGINRDGRVMTFGSAGIPVDGGEMSVAEIPQMSYLINFFTKNPYLSAGQKVNLLRALSPSSSRRYFNVSKEKFTADVRQRLLAEYSRLTGLDASQIVLFAITEPGSGVTFLLPDFYRLENSAEQAAILFHEAFWIFKPEASYKQVVSAEMAFQKYLENLNSPDLMIAWLSKIVSADELVSAGAKSDFANNILSSIAPMGKLPVRTLFGDAAVDCFFEGGSSSCTDRANSHILELSLAYPDSMMLQVFSYLIKSGRNVKLDDYRYHRSSPTVGIGSYILESKRSEYWDRAAHLGDKVIFSTNSHSNFQLNTPIEDGLFFTAEIHRICRAKKADKVDKVYQSQLLWIVIY